MTPEDIERILHYVELAEEFAAALFALMVVSCVWIGWDAKRSGLKLGLGGWAAIILLWPFSVLGYPAWKARKRTKS